MHPVDSEGCPEGPFRVHSGPSFGQFLSAFAEEYAHFPGELRVRLELLIDVPEPGIHTLLPPTALRRLARDAERAAAWLEAHQ